MNGSLEAPHSESKVPLYVASDHAAVSTRYALALSALVGADQTQIALLHILTLGIWLGRERGFTRNTKIICRTYAIAQG